MLTNLPVLVLNQSYEPLHVCRVRRAIVLIYENKAEMLENGSGHLHTANFDFPVPSVIRLAELVRRPHWNSATSCSAAWRLTADSICRKPIRR